jgi:arylformamidase
MVGQYYDISPRLDSSLAVFPGDQPFSRTVAMSFGKGHHLDLSAIATTLHAGAHADAPSHYDPKGVTIERRDLSFYIGPCSVIRVKVPAGARIGLKSLSGRDQFQPRVLFATDSFNDPTKWREDFNSFEPELLNFLADRGVRLVGIDTPSVDPHDSKALEAHHVLAKRDLAVLEGLFLKDVPVGDYFLVALPLAIAGGEASPVRAALWPRNHEFD